MRRRDFITLLGGAAAWPLAARAQQDGRLRRIGVIGAASLATQGQLVGNFAQRLRDLGWIEDRSLALEVRWAEGSNERAAEIAAELVRLKVDVIVTIGTPEAAAAERATSAIPIVFVLVGDPLGTGLVTSLARPGGNFTGLSNQATDTSTKRLELLREVVPGLRRLAIMGNVNSPVPVLEMAEVQAAAQALGLATVRSEIRQADDIAPAFEALKGRVDALYVATEGLLSSNRIVINTLALFTRMPTVHGNREMLEGGGLMSFGASQPVLFRRAAEIVDKILRGANPGDIPVEQPTKFELVVNMKTAKALGLAVPSSVQLQADEVVE